MEEQLVSITVISYNSEKTIVETLESIKNQSYRRLELIISDDCSTDSTVQLCKNWILKNKKRFERVELLTAEKNEGVSANGAKGIKAVKGVWTKGIAADDILMPNCVSDCMAFAKENPDAAFIISLISVYNESFEEDNCIIREKGPKNIEIFKQPIEVQVKQMAYDSFIQAPSTFCKKEVYDAIGGKFKKYPFEDWPLYMNVLEKGYKLFYMDKVTVGYRFHQSSSNATGKVFNYQFVKQTHEFIKERCFKYYTWRKKLATYIRWTNEWLLYVLHLDNKNKFNQFLYDCQASIVARIGGRVKYVK